MWVFHKLQLHFRPKLLIYININLYLRIQLLKINSEKKVES